MNFTVESMVDWHTILNKLDDMVAKRIYKSYESHIWYNELVCFDGYMCNVELVKT